MEFSSWAILKEPSIFALVPLIIYVVMAFKGKNNVSGLIVGIFVGAILLGVTPKMLGSAYQKAMGSTTALMGLIIVTGAGLGVLMSETRISHTLVYWIVKKVGVTTQTRGKIALIICSILICGMLGTMGGGNAVIAPIMIPTLASLGITPTVVATLFKVSGEVGLILGPLTGVTLITMDVTGLSYGELFLYATFPFSVVWLTGTWIGCNRAQKRTQGTESYTLDDDVKDIDSIVVTSQQKRSTVLFLVSFILLVGYGIYSKQSTNYALIVMIILAAVVGISARMDIDKVVASLVKGIASQTNMLLIFINIEVLLNLVEAGGGFSSLANMLSGLVEGGGPTSVMLVAAVVGGFGIEAAAVAEIKIIASMFGELARESGLPMSCFAISILAATRLTGSTYPTTNFAGQMGTAQCQNTKEALQACWVGVGFVVVFILIWSFIGPRILS